MKFTSIKTRLRAIVLFAIFSLLIIGYSSISGMKVASGAIDSLYSEEMINSNRANTIIKLLGNARSDILMAFQHDPDSNFAAQHDHPVSVHIDNANQSLTKIITLLNNKLAENTLTPKTRNTISMFLKELESVNEKGFQPAINAINQNNYTRANQILWQSINPKFTELEKLADNYLNVQIANAKKLHHTTEEKINTLIIMQSVVIVAVLIIMALLAYMINRRVFTVLGLIQSVAGDVAGGDLTKRMALNGEDELAAISHHVDQIVSSFQDVVTHMDDYAGQLSCAAEQGSAVVIQTKQNVIDQQQQTQLVATAIHEFTATVQDVANSAASAAQTSEQAEKITQQGKQVVDSSIAMINELVQEMTQATDIITTLSEQSIEIGSVVEVISGISDQTNLLALNAAIEAARVGEAGRGFAVVADEVRSLAQRTQDSTESIKTMILQLQESSSKSLQRMESGAQQAKITVKKAGDAGQALEDILKSVNQINAFNIQIAAAAEQQNVVTDEINQNITSIHEISTDTAAGAEQSSAATLELARLTEEMKASVSKYRYL